MVGASPNSGTFYNNICAMKVAGLITYPKQGFIRASDSLFMPNCVRPVGDMMGV